MPNTKPKTLAIDLDGTLIENEFPGWGKPIDGMRDELRTLRAMGWKIVVWTVRHDLESVKKHLMDNSIPFDYINENPYGPEPQSRKIYADVYLDDRAMSFDGDTKGLAGRVMAHKEWHKVNPFAAEE